MSTDVIGVEPPQKQVAPPLAIPQIRIVRKLPKASTTAQAVPIAARPRSTLFSEVLLDMSSTRQPRRSMDAVVSILFHVVFLIALVIVPLYFTETIDLKGFTATLLVAPPPPPPPPPPAQAVVRATPTPRRTFLASGKLIAPTSIPQRIATLKEEPLPPEAGFGVVGGVPGGVPGGQLGGVIGGILSGASRTNVPLPVSATVQPRAPIRVGGRVKPPRALLKPPPVYPPLARQTRVQGVVTIDAVLDTEGNVVEMQVVSGHPLLIPAALDAVKQWKYEPTYLNDQAIAVQLIVTVTFQLGQ